MKTIVWDLDDVLNTLMKDWCEDPDYGQKYQASFEQLTQNPPHEILGITKEQYLSSLDSFRLTKAAKKPPHPEVLSWFQEKGHLFEHRILTARPIHTSAQASDWVFTFFGQWVRGFFFVPSTREDDPSFSYEKNKKDMLKKMKHVDYFIDDTPSNIKQAEELSIKSFTFPAPWNSQKASITEILDQIKE